MTFMMIRMPDRLNLAVLAKRHVPGDLGVATCWAFVVRGMEVGWLGRDDVDDLIEHLRGGADFGVQELSFDHLGDVLRVSFLDDQATCSPGSMVEALRAILREVDGGGAG